MNKIILRNKGANFNFETIKTYQAGIELQGWEIKSIRNNNVSLNNAFCVFKKHELYLINMHISKYMNVQGDEVRSRKLLLNAHELKKIQFEQETKGYSIIPKALLFNPGGLVKVEIILGKAKTKYDKREVIKKRDEKRMLQKFY